MNSDPSLREQLKAMLVETLMLQSPASAIADDEPLFGPGSMGLDSVDALQLVVALDKHFGLKIADQNTAKQALQSVNSMAVAIERHRANG